MMFCRASSIEVRVFAAALGAMLSMMLLRASGSISTSLVAA
jgi:hypothetical protein